MKTILRCLAASLLGMAIAIIWTGCSGSQPQIPSTNIGPGMPEDIKRSELLERAKYELATAKVNLARRKCSEVAKNVEAGRRILKDNIPAAETLPKTKTVLDEIQRVELQNLETWAGDLEKEAQQVGTAEQYRDAREKLRALLAIKDSNLSVEKRDEIELKINLLDKAYEAQKSKEAIRLSDRDLYDVNREADQLYREVQHLYSQGRYTEARDKVEQMKTVSQRRWALPATPTLNGFDNSGRYGVYEAKDSGMFFADGNVTTGHIWSDAKPSVMGNGELVPGDSGQSWDLNDANGIIINGAIDAHKIPEVISNLNGNTFKAENRSLTEYSKLTLEAISSAYSPGMTVGSIRGSCDASSAISSTLIGRTAKFQSMATLAKEGRASGWMIDGYCQDLNGNDINGGSDYYTSGSLAGNISGNGQLTGKGNLNMSGQPDSIKGLNEILDKAAREVALEDIPSTDEVWIIEKPAARPASTAPAARPDLLEAGKNGELIPIPLQHSSYDVKIAGILAETHVRQTYANPFTAKIEATYVFPLPDDAAVTDFLMIIGDRRIRGLIREREEAKRIYAEAKSQGYVAALLTEERPNLFTQKVANIEPGKRIDIDITYFNTAKYLDGEFELALPTVVGPRYNPAGTTDGVDAVPRGKGCQSPQAVAIEYLAPNERSGHMIDITVELDPQVTVERIASPSHEIATQTLGDGRSRITLKAQQTVPNRDFILHWRPAGKPLQTAFWIGGTEKERTFALLLLPPASEKVLPRQPREMIFVIDRSGSMSGQPMAKVQEAMRNCLNGLDGNDTFQVVEFSNSAASLGNDPVPATEANIKRAIDYVNKLDGSGGTEFKAGFNVAFNIPHDPKKLRIISIMTDGDIGNENDVLAQVKRQLNGARIFAFGVGSSPNRHLIESLAAVGHGAAAFVGLNEDSGTMVGQFYRRAAYPALTDVAIDWDGLKVADVFPRHIPDLFAGRPVLVTGRLTSAIPKDTRISICGNRGGETVRAHLPVSAATIPIPAVCHIWARHKIARLLLENAAISTPGFQKDLAEFSISHAVLCPYTAFLAVDASRVTEGNTGYSVNVPVPVPDGVRYDTTVLDPGQRKN